jgi:hypothetical protein
MNQNELFKNIFSLAVKLVGLYFLYLAFRDIPPLLQLTSLPGYTRTDVITAVLPPAFDLAAGWWLMANKFLIRCAYPESRKSPTANHPRPPADPAPLPVASPLSEKSPATVERKLAALVKKTGETID